LFILFNFVPQLSSDELKLFDCSLSQISLIIFIFFYFYFTYFQLHFSGHQHFLASAKLWRKSF